MRYDEFQRTCDVREGDGRYGTPGGPDLRQVIPRAHAGAGPAVQGTAKARVRAGIA